MGGARQAAHLTLARIERLVARQNLTLLGGFLPDADDALPSTGTLLLLGPRQPGFWTRFTATPEWKDGAPDPIDRWSLRIISALAAELGGTARFPFGGPPFQPFQRWAQRSGRCHISPVGLLVHDRSGLMVSFRGALLLPERLDLPPPPPEPCPACVTKPCLSACPVGALGAKGYDVPSCRAYLAEPEGVGCLNGGCAVRRSCPVGQEAPQDSRQSAYHMRSFTR
jgi:hypothetical protein